MLSMIMHLNITALTIFVPETTKVCCMFLFFQSFVWCHFEKLHFQSRIMPITHVYNSMMQRSKVPTIVGLLENEKLNFFLCFLLICFGYTNFHFTIVCSQI